MAKEILKVYENKADEPKKPSYQWWACSVDETHLALVPLFRTIDQKQEYRRIRNVRYARLYNNQDILGQFSTIYSQTYDATQSKLTLNIIASVVDTLSSKIAKQKTRPYFLTEDGQWKYQEKAKKLQKFVDGQFNSMGHYETKQQSFVHSCVFGTGATKLYTAEGEVHSENSIIDEIVVDDAEGMYGKPRSIYQKRFVDREVLISMFPTKEALIKQSGIGVPTELDAKSTSDLIMVVEGWHLPSKKGAKDGRHAICIENATLLGEPWEFPWFPFTSLRYKDSLTGWYGIGAGESLLPIQLEINRTLQAIQKSHRLTAIPRVFLQTGSKVNKAHLTNDIGSIIEYTPGMPPIFDKGTAMAGEIYSFLENLWNKGFAQEGISQMSAASVKPAGLNSGVALREYQDVESDRFQLVGQRYEQSFLEDAVKTIAMTKQLAARGTKVTVLLGGYSNAERIVWKDVEMEDDKYILKVFPASILPTTPAGKLQTVQEMMESALIDKDTAMTLLDFPDLKDAMNVTTANQQLVKKQIDRMLAEDGVYDGPEPYFGLQWAKQFAQLSYLRAKMDGAPDDRLELLRTYMTDCDTMLQASAMSMAPPQGMPPAGAPQGGDPMAQPAAPPVSDLLPVA